MTLSITGGESDKSGFCVFAGGYATGDATGTVYTVDSVTVDIEGGVWTNYTTDHDGAYTWVDWVEAHGGRGIFGGIMTSGVEAQVLGDVNITISGDETTMGNVYGGGWAQKGGTSIVGDVNINIEGGTVTNVFGGGSTSSTAPGGSTVAENVTITIKGSVLPRRSGLPR